MTTIYTLFSHLRLFPRPLTGLQQKPLRNTTSGLLLLYTCNNQVQVGQFETIEQCCRIIAYISAEIQYGLISIQLDTHPKDSAHSYISISSSNNNSFKAVCVHCHRITVPIYVFKLLGNVSHFFTYIYLQLSKHVTRSNTNLHPFSCPIKLTLPNPTSSYHSNNRRPQANQ